MRERVSVLEVEEMQYKVCISNEAGSGEPNPGLRPKFFLICCYTELTRVWNYLLEEVKRFRLFNSENITMLVTICREFY